MIKKPKKTPFFLDTTIQITRLFGLEAEKKKILKLLYNNTIYTSGYVFAEFIGTIVKDLFFIINCLSEKQTSKGNVRLNDILRLVSRANGIHTTKRSRRLFLLVASILDEFDKDKMVDNEEIIIFLRGIIRECLVNDFFVINFTDYTYDMLKNNKFINKLKCDLTNMKMNIG